MNNKSDRVALHFDQLQSQIVDRFVSLDPEVDIYRGDFTSNTGGKTQPRILANGKIIEKAAVQFSHSLGDALPQAASERNPQLAGKPFVACSISVIVHPLNPHVPTSHMNLRFFEVQSASDKWYFGGGFDLTPYLPYEDDARQWHEAALAACGSPDRYQQLKQNCDEYFYLNHRNEPRGVGGVFFDDWIEGGFESSLEFIAGVGETFLETYTRIFKRRMSTTWTPDEESWMLLRRGRYAEFNLIQDRGTKYGLQSGHRVESILASLPPRVHWGYPPQIPEHGEFQTKLDEFLRRKSWAENVENFVEKSDEHR